MSFYFQEVEMRWHRNSAVLVLSMVAVAIVGLSACAPKPVEVEEVVETPAEEALLVVETGDADYSDGYSPLPGYAPMNIPADNPMTVEKVALGHQLFFDYRLSGDETRSCYHCHVNEKGLADGMPTAVGAFEKALTRNSPTLWNIGFHSEFYWDGRAKSLEAQALAAWKGGNMVAAEVQEAVDRVNAVEAYQDQFQAVFGSEGSVENIPMALAAYMRTIVSGTTAYDRWQAGDEDAVSDAAKRGHQIFKEAGCAECHSGKLFTDQQFHNVGIGMDAESPDVGRYKVTELEQNMGAFKTPTMRDVARSGPYFHNGSVASLEEAVRLMASGGIANDHLDNLMVDKELGDDQLADLIAFLESLSETAILEAPAVP
jgi:cytochrome c peroxidase